MSDDANLRAPNSNAVRQVASGFICMYHCFGVFGEAVSSHSFSFCNRALLDRGRSSSGTVFTNVHAIRAQLGRIEHV